MERHEDEPRNRSLIMRYKNDLYIYKYIISSAASQNGAIKSYAGEPEGYCLLLLPWHYRRWAATNLEMQEIMPSV